MIANLSSNLAIKLLIIFMNIVLSVVRNTKRAELAGRRRGCCLPTVSRDLRSVELQRKHSCMCQNVQLMNVFDIL